MHLLREKREEYVSETNTSGNTSRSTSETKVQGKGNGRYKDNIFRYLFSEKKNFVQPYYDLTN